MALHRELFTDLPPAEEMLAMYSELLNNARNADGYYALVQLIAEKYGEKAYELAEEVFQEMGLEYDPGLLRTPDTVRRVGYNNDGANIYAIEVKPYKPEMAYDLVRIYNAEMRHLSYDALMDEKFFHEQIVRVASDGLWVACDGGGNVAGFLHGVVDRQGAGSLEVLVFSHGRIYDPASKALVEKARQYFADQKVQRVAILGGRLPYPFYTAVKGDLFSAFIAKLPHIAHKLESV